MDKQIVLATGNSAKRDQLRWLLDGLPFSPVGAPTVSVAETAPDLPGNARLKALAYSASGLAIASDGGLVVPALGDVWNPVLTARQGPQQLRSLTSGLADRRVCWSEAVAIAERGVILGCWAASGTSGVLLPEPWPEPREFWVWDLFLFPELGKTWSELGPGERERADQTWTKLRQDVRQWFMAS